MGTVIRAISFKILRGGRMETKNKNMLGGVHQKNNMGVQKKKCRRGGGLPEQNESGISNEIAFSSYTLHNGSSRWIFGYFV